MYVVIYSAAKRFLFVDHDVPPAWLAVPLATPFGILVGMIVRNEARPPSGVVGVRTIFGLLASTVIAFAIAAGIVEFLFTDDNAPNDITYAVAGGAGGFIGAVVLATAIWVLLRRNGARFAGWPMVIAGMVVGGFWSEEAFYMRPPLTVACLLFPFWQACVAVGLWFGLRKEASDSPRQLGGEY